MRRKFYVIGKEIFTNSKGTINGKAKAIAYCKSNNLPESVIVELTNQNEYRFYQALKVREEKGEIQELETCQRVKVFNGFVNSVGEDMPSIEMEISFTYFDEKGFHSVLVLDSVYELNKELIMLKILFDHMGVITGRVLEVYYPNLKGDFVEYKVGNYKTIAQEIYSLNHQQELQERKLIRERQKYDRLLRLRNEGKITNNQRQELYRLEKVYKGDN